MRKNYLDNIRWITVWIVVLFHVFFYFNNIGVEAMFKNAGAYTEGTYTFAGIFQYVVYPWFMLLLFIIAGMSSFYAFQKRTSKEFIKERTRKLLIPSTLGLLVLAWLPGSISAAQYAPLPAEIPSFVMYFIHCFMGTGALWFCQVLFVFSLLVLIVRKIDPNNKFQNFCSKCNIIVLLLFYFLIWLFSKILNMPVITAYRFGIYGLGFFLGYFVFSNDSVQESLKKWGLPIFACAIVAGIFYVRLSYGKYYASHEVLQTWITNLYAWLMVLSVLGLGNRFLNFSNSFTTYMKKSSFGVYVLHITVILVGCNFLAKTQLPIWSLYILLALIAVAGSLLLWEILRHVYVIRYFLFGIKSKKKEA